MYVASDSVVGRVIALSPPPTGGPSDPPAAAKLLWSYSLLDEAAHHGIPYTQVLPFSWLAIPSDGCLVAAAYAGHVIVLQ